MYIQAQKAGFHNATDAEKAELRNVVTATKFSYEFHNHFHPYVSELLAQLNKRSISGLFDPEFHKELKKEQAFFQGIYNPNESDKTVEVKGDLKQIDVSEGGPYAVYNWEFLFHAPFTIAVHLSKNQRFAEAQRWFHLIFDPSGNDKNVDAPQRYWTFLAFRDQKEDIKQIDDLLYILAKPENECSSDEMKIKERILSGYEAIRNKPFQPHVVARTRFLAYQYAVVMKYLDNLIAWGDSLFRQDTIETINEATQLYVLAANILGPRPQRIPRRGKVRPKTFAQLRAKELDPLGNPLVELEAEFPFNLYSPRTEGMESDQARPLFGIGRTLYFCVPKNDMLLGYWDTVADRLFKIRHCMNIEGIVRQLPLFQPSIDPGMLVKAAAAGIDISSLVSGLNQPFAPVRSALLIQKALEICGEVRAMGNSLLSAFEKEDAEDLALRKQEYETKTQKLALTIQLERWKQALETTNTLWESREVTLEKYGNYRRLLGREGKEDKEKVDALKNLSLAEFEKIALEEMTEESFADFLESLVEKYALDVPEIPYHSLDLKDEGKLYLSRNEHEELNVAMPKSQFWQEAVHWNDILASGLFMIPDVALMTAYWGIGPDVKLMSGQAFGQAAKAVSSGLQMKAAKEISRGSSAAKKASYERRANELIVQHNLAARELMHIGRKIIEAKISEQIAYHEYLKIQTQIEHSEEIKAVLEEKFTNKDLYSWMQGELFRLYYEYYKFAYDIARKAEQMMKHELMRPELDDMNFIEFNYWDGGRKGLLSAEALHLDLKRMEMAYHDYNKREYELTKHISLRQLDPVQLLRLKATGSCEVTLPEWLFDLDCPGHYMRRIKSVGLTIPAVTGPYINVNCTLSLLKSSLRCSALLADDDYARKDSKDERFRDYYGTIQSIVTSSANNDSGLFETNLRDERFLPFEGAGAVSMWKLELPAEYRQFDYNTISDVILHMRYTARQGGVGLRNGTTGCFADLMADKSTDELMVLFSLNRDFPSEWSQFIASEEEPLTITIERGKHFPYMAQSMAISVDGVEIRAIQDRELVGPSSAELDEVVLEQFNQALNDNTPFELSLSQNDVLVREDKARVFLLIKYHIE